MKNSALWTKCAVAGAMALMGVTGCGGSGGDAGGSSGNEVSASSISSAINTATRGKVTANVQGDTVTLTGTVPSPDKVATAATVAGGIAGGKKIVNQVTVGQ